MFSDAYSCVLQLVTLLLRLVHSIRLVLSGRVYCHQFQRRLARVPELMLRPSWHNDDIVGGDLLLAACNVGFAFAGGEDAIAGCQSILRQDWTCGAGNSQHLIHSMYFISNITTNRNLHRHKLRVHAGMQHLSEDAKLADVLRQALEVDELMRRRRRLVLVSFGEVSHDAGCGVEEAESRCGGAKGLAGGNCAVAEKSATETGSEH